MGEFFKNQKGARCSKCGNHTFPQKKVLCITNIVQIPEHAAVISHSLLTSVKLKVSYLTTTLVPRLITDHF